MGKFQLFPVQASTLAPEVDHLLYFLLAVSTFFTLLIFGAIFYFAIRYRRRSENELPHVAHTGYTLEIVWSVIPFGLTMVMFTWGASIFFNQSRPPDNAMQIYAVGKQWMWKLEHQEGVREINELHVPVGRPIRAIPASTASWTCKSRPWTREVVTGPAVLSLKALWPAAPKSTYICTRPTTIRAVPT